MNRGVKLVIPPLPPAPPIIDDEKIISSMSSLLQAHKDQIFLELSDAIDTERRHVEESLKLLKEETDLSKEFNLLKKKYSDFKKHTLVGLIATNGIILIILFLRGYL